MQHLDDAALLRQQGHRLTPQRMQVLQVIKTHGQHLTAEEIHAAILPQQPFLDIATVYRTLQWLQSIGLVAPISMGDGKQRYEYRRPGEHHHHLICQSCGHETQVPDEVLSDLKTALQKRYGFTLRMDHLAFTGRCAICAAAEDANE